MSFFLPLVDLAIVALLFIRIEKFTLLEDSGEIEHIHYNAVFQLGPVRFSVAEHSRRRRVRMPADNTTAQN
jgi:hypothetical protein